MGDVNYMRVQFYISGSKGKATVHVEAKEVITCFSYFDIIYYRWGYSSALFLNTVISYLFT